MAYFALFYETVDDYENRRVPFRADHLKHANAARERGELVMAGAFTNPADGALLVFQGEAAGVAEAFARADPYVQNGLITQWRVRAWNVVVKA